MQNSSPKGGQSEVTRLKRLEKQSSNNEFSFDTVGAGNIQVLEFNILPILLLLEYNVKELTNYLAFFPTCPLILLRLPSDEFLNRTDYNPILLRFCECHLRFNFVISPFSSRNCKSFN